MIDITSDTKLAALIGDPVSASMSPAMHNAAFRELGLDYIYLPFRVKAPDLGGAIAGLRALGARGFNVTMPYKVAVIPLLDELDAAANDIGAVNTVVNDAGKLRGYNTDGQGFLLSLREKGVEPEDKNLVVLGAGGASRAISYSLVSCGASVTILNRDAGKAASLANQVGQVTSREVRHGSLLDSLPSTLEKAEILVNTTKVGMKPDTGESPVPATLLRPELVVCDIVYNPPETRLLREARAAGLKTVDGVGMFVWQGTLAFELWTGQKPPLALMRDTVLAGLDR